jgi:lantibiotic biosynthesis protein
MRPRVDTPGPAVSTVSAPRPARGRLFEPLDWALARAPLLPVEAQQRAHADLPDESLMPEDRWVRAAVAVASPDLYSALSRVRPADPEAARVRSKLHRYVIRMTTRPTPYGLFAGVGLIGWGASTSLRIAASEPRTRTRLDMQWLSGLLDTLEGDIAVRRGLGFAANPTAFVRAGRVFLAEPPSDASGGAAEPVSLRATPVVRRTLELARRPVAYEQLVNALVAATGAASEKVEALITDLWERGVLLSDLRPPLTGTSPARYVRDRLAKVPAAAETQRLLDELLATLEDWDALPLDDRPEALPAVLKRIDQMHPVALSASPLQVDTALSLGGRTVHSAVAAAAALGAELLLRMTPYPDGLPQLHAYRHAFEARYGPERAVGLLELLDPQFGLGPPQVGRADGGGLDSPRAAARGRVLQEIALRAQRDPGCAVELDDELAARLATWSAAPDTAPLSLDISVFVAAASAAALDAGDFQVVVGPNVGANGAGRNAGRFAELLGPDALAALRRTADTEAACEPRRLYVEMVYAPSQPRLANVTIRPAIRAHEIALGTMPGVAWDGVIRLEELVVEVRDGAFHIVWPAAGAELVVAQGHMLNPVHAPAVVRFLLDVAADRRAHLSSFNWGPASAFPYLPRIQRGRIVLSLAQWRVTPRDLADAQASDATEGLADWRRTWCVPRHVYLAAGDNRLLLDLQDAASAALLRAELRRLPEHGSVVLQEGLPGPDEAWVPGVAGRYLLELVVPLARRGNVAGEPARSLGSPVRQPTAPANRRLRPPGSDWLYLKLYCPPALHDEVIAGPLRTFAQFAQSASLIDGWFFVRYADPDPHLRVRFHGDPGVLLGTLLGQVCGWANALVADGASERFSFETYDREIERYGGDRGVTLAEAIFASDSAAVANILHLDRGHGASLDRLLVAMLSIDDLVAACGLDEYQRLRWYRGQTSISREDGREYRRRRADFTALLGDPAGVEAGTGGAPLRQILAARREALSPVAAELDAQGQEDALHSNKASLCRSYVHLHCNRLLAAGSPIELRALQLLRRTHERLRLHRGPS